MRNSDLCDLDAWGGGDRQISALTGQTAEPKCWALGSCEKTCLKKIPQWVASGNKPWGQHLGSICMCMCARTHTIHTHQCTSKINNDWSNFVYVSMCASVGVFRVFLHVAHLYSTQSFCWTGNFFLSLLLPNQTTKPVWVMTERTQISPSAGLRDSSLRKSLSFCMGFLFWVLRACHPLHCVGSAVFPVL